MYKQDRVVQWPVNNYCWFNWCGSANSVAFVVCNVMYCG